jgi:hypothetical protein
VSVAHAADETEEHGLRAGRLGPHGITAIERELNSGGRIDVRQLAETYSKVPGGYLQTYGGIEAVLGLTDGGKVPGPGPAADGPQLSVLDEVVTLADRDRPLSAADLARLRHLCLCVMADAPDGRCVRRAYFTGQGGSDGSARTHRFSATLLVRALAGRAVDELPDLCMDGLCCFTPGLRDVLADQGLYEHALAWRGALLRNWSVWAWRLIWAKLVAPLQTPGTRQHAIAEFVRDLPDLTVRQALIEQLPPLMDAATGALRPVEHELYEDPRNAHRWTVPDMLRLLAIGAARLTDLDPVSYDAFLGQIPDDRGPAYVAQWLEREADRPLVEAITDLADGLFQRAEAVSRQKMQWTRYGLRLPTRLRRVGDRWRLEGEEGAGAVSLRLDTFTSVMHQLGILAIDGQTWTAGRFAGEASP